MVYLKMWTDDLDDCVERARLVDGPWDWFAAAQAGVGSMPATKRDHLAALGLAELVSWSHKIDREATAPCAGEQAARERYPRLFLTIRGSKARGR